MLVGNIGTLVLFASPRRPSTLVPGSSKARARFARELHQIMPGKYRSIGRYMTTTLLEQRTNLSLDSSAQAGGQPPRKSLVLKPSAAQQGGTAHFSLLPTQKPRLGVMGASLTLQLAILGVLLLLPLVFPQRLIPKMSYDVMPIATPRTEVPVAKPEPVKPKPQPVPVEVAKVLPPVQPKILIVPHVVAPKVPPKPVEKVEAPKINTPVLETPKVEIASAPAQPRRPVETGVIRNTGSAAPATLNKPPEKIQTGGFGDPQGIGGPSNPNARANINHVGSFDLPPGPGYGNGTGGANGARGTVQSTGFGNGTAIPPTGGGSRGSVQQSGFAQAAIDPTKAKAQQQQQAAAVQPVEILDKPKPEYTDDARALKLEGEVKLNVNFKANGQIEVLGVTHGLGHGLDESAIRAAQRIKYKPAVSNGQAVDFPATVIIEFQLAY
jgi:TonB family protein